MGLDQRIVLTGAVVAAAATSCATSPRTLEQALTDNEAAYCKDGELTTMAERDQLTDMQRELADRFTVAMQDQGAKFAKMGIEPDNSIAVEPQQVWFCETVRESDRMLTVHTSDGYRFIVINNKWLQTEQSVPDVAVDHEVSHLGQPYGGWGWMNEAAADRMAGNPDVQPKYFAAQVWWQFFVGRLAQERGWSDEQAEKFLLNSVYQQQERQQIDANFWRKLLIAAGVNQGEAAKVAGLLVRKEGHPGYAWLALVEVVNQSERKQWWLEQLKITNDQFEQNHAAVKAKLRALTGK